MIAGPTQSGKTSLLIKIIKNLSTMCDKKVDRIVYCYSRPQDSLKELTAYNVELHDGLPDVDHFDAASNNLLILDDLMEECEKDKSILNMFTVDSHHKNISTFFLTQNLFSKGRYFRTISLNCHYMIIFNNPRDKSQIGHLARQMYPNNPLFLSEAFEDATSNLHGYLFLDLKQSTNNNHRVQTCILTNETRIIYQPK